MFNVTVKGNVRCNGMMSPSVGGLLAKRPIAVTRPQQSPGAPPLSDTKLKFSDRLKAYLHTDDQRSDGMELDDPYAFSDGDNFAARKGELRSPRVPGMERSPRESKGKLPVRVNSVVNHVENDHSVVKSETSVAGSGKTMSRLQAQIARNKITVKHNRNSPDLNHFEKITKHSIIGLVNNVNNNNSKNRRLPSGKPMPSHLRARRISSKNITQHEGSLQRIPYTSGVIKTPGTSVGVPNPGQQTTWHAPQPYGPLAGNRSASAVSTRLAGPFSDSEEDAGVTVYQRHWFNKELELLSTEESSRESRLEITRQELKRQIQQMKKSKIGSWRLTSASSVAQTGPLSSVASLKTYIQTVAKSLQNMERQRMRRSPGKGPGGAPKGRNCSDEECNRPALPCTKHCSLHIMNNSDQILFEHCTAKFADNTQCSVPVFDILHELPLCIEHARKRDNYNRMCQETKPKKPRRKIKPSAMIRPQKRNKKRKRSTTHKIQEVLTSLQNDSSIPSSNHVATDVGAELNVCETSSAYESSEDVAIGGLSETEFVTIKTEDHIGDQDVVEQVLAMQDEVGGDLELVVEQTLVTQASRLLEETDFTNVLNQIPPDEFNDLFAVDRNGEYEPSREETEELERALEAVDEDVKKLTATQGLLDSLLDEHTLVESLVQIPDVFHNGYEVIDNSATHQSPSRALPSFHPALHTVEGILPVQPQAHTPS